MDIKPSDPDIQTLYGRIDSGDLDLRPEFQRGEVWSDGKRQRLIDTILREWQVPPIHVVIDSETGKQFVLDGQQRLAAIRDFVRGEIVVDGRIDPVDPRIQRLHGKCYAELPVDVKRAFDRYALRVFSISRYMPEEPGELFFRLNQNAPLRPAEQRNAFFGAARRQVKDVVKLVVDGPIADKLLGFGNSRMALDDVVARALVVLEKKTLRVRLSPTLLIDKYRSESGFGPQALECLRGGLSLMERSAGFSEQAMRLNKATAFSWMVFSSRVHLLLPIDPAQFAGFMEYFESERNEYREAAYRPLPRIETSFSNWRRQAIGAYEDRATSRVSDVSSVVLRDLALWAFFLDFAALSGAIRPDFPQGTDLSQLALFLQKTPNEQMDIEEFSERLQWGKAI